MTLKDNPLAAFSVLISIMGMAIAVGHVSAVAMCLSHSADAFMHLYHFVFATIACWLSGFVLSIISIKSGDEQGFRASHWNLSSLVIIIICVWAMRSFGAF